MLEELFAALPDERHPRPLEDLRPLDRANQRAFSDPEDRERSGRSDPHGLGGGPRRAGV